MKRVAVITGAQQGIGAAVARALVSPGQLACVVNYFDDHEAAKAVVGQINARGGEAIAVQADITLPDEVDALFAQAAELGQLRVLVNNAAIFPRCPLLDISDSQWDEVLGVNLRGGFLCLRKAARIMVDAGEGGSIVNVASLAAHRATPRGAHYTAAKAGLLGLTRAAALELAEHRIRVNCVAPGLTDTAQPRYGMSEDEIAAAATNIPLGRLAQPEDIAAMIAFLCGEQSQHITGQVMHVNGGQYFNA